MALMEQKIEIKTERLKSLDVLRGFTMFWIIGGGLLVHTLEDATGWQVLSWFSNQLTHVKWNGFHFYDLIFPLFMFVSGVAMPYSIGMKLKQGTSKKKLFAKAAKRGLILILFGIIYNNKVSFDFANMRYASVLGQIGVAYFIAASIYLYSGLRGQVIWTVLILLGFWALMALVPVPGYGAGVLTPEGNLSGYIDRLLLPGTTYREHYDPQGILLMISAATITLMGAITGSLIINEKLSKERKTVILTTLGIVLIGLSLIWNIWYPINKEIWSSSFNLLTIGISLLFMAVFYFIIDIKGYAKWSFPFVLIGLNPITIYMASRMVNFRFTSDYILTGIINLSGDFSGVISAIGVLGLELLLLYFLYKRKIFLRV
jgi:predicted acyltransferase